MPRFRSACATGFLCLTLGGAFALTGCNSDAGTPPPANPSNPGGLTDEMVKQIQANEENAKAQKKAHR